MIFGSKLGKKWLLVEGISFLCVAVLFCSYRDLRIVMTGEFVAFYLLAIRKNTIYKLM